jgi:hypothetical protein
MKGLIITLIVIVALIGVGIGVSAHVYTNLINGVATAHESGFGEGYAQGYEDGFKEGSEAGYQEGSRVGYAKEKGVDSSNNVAAYYFLYNPTYGEVQELLVEAGAGSAKEIHDYAESNGIRAAYVRCPIAREAPKGMVYLYQLVAFETVDRGLIIVEPWSHREVKVEVGESYSKLNGFPASPYDDAVTKMTIVW